MHSRRWAQLTQFLGRLGKLKNDKYLLHHQDDNKAEDQIIKAGAPQPCWWLTGRRAM